ncbi:MinD/ParA family protein [Pseudonocardia sp. MH-G8]|uniref:MinD/ParA family ATP-binding protein n=1 Tax=Pseudonocardia sp. MH-G8 TaxID=1854588 RepID=UPI001E510B33|nr:MinD/ParA family protein [Pseudonocardia sp. MH-G8]
MSSTNHTSGTTPSWLADQGSSAWAVGRPRSSGRPSSPDWSSVPEPTEPPPAPTDGDQAAEDAPAKDQPVTAAPAGEGPAKAAEATPAPTPAPAPDPAEASHPAKPAWHDGDNLLTNVVRTRKSPPREGWRAFVYRASGGRWNPGLSQGEARLREQMQKIRTPLPGPHSVVVASIKGGIGKTTVSALLGLALAEHRGDRVIAIDANPDAGTLGDRLVGEEAASKITMRDLLNNIDQVRSSTQLAGYTHLAGRLQVLTSEQEPELSEMFSATDYETVLRLLARFYEAIVTDSGTGVVHSAMQGSLIHADSLVIVGAPTQDGASRASRTLQWLAMHGYPELVREAVVVLSYDRHSPYVDESVIHEHFRSRCRAVIELPSDRHLATGGLIELDALSPATRDATLELAATVADGFHSPRTRGLAAHGFRSETPR